MTVRMVFSRVFVSVGSMSDDDEHGGAQRIDLGADPHEPAGEEAQRVHPGRGFLPDEARGHDQPADDEEDGDGPTADRGRAGSGVDRIALERPEEAAEVTEHDEADRDAAQAVRARMRERPWGSGAAVT